MKKSLNIDIVLATVNQLKAEYDQRIREYTESQATVVTLGKFQEYQGRIEALDNVIKDLSRLTPDMVKKSLTDKTDYERLS